MCGSVFWTVARSVRGGYGCGYGAEGVTRVVCKHQRGGVVSKNMRLDACIHRESDGVALIWNSYVSLIVNCVFEAVGILQICWYWCSKSKHLLGMRVCGE